MKYPIILPWKCRLRSPFTKIAISQLLYDWFLPIFDRNNGTVASCKSVISTDPKNVGQNHNLKKKHISAIIQLILSKLSSKWCNWGWQQKYHISWPWKCRSWSHFTKLYLGYYQANSNQILIHVSCFFKFSSWMIDDSS